MKHFRRVTFLLFLSFVLTASIPASSILANTNGGGPSQLPIAAFTSMHLEMYKNYVVKVFPPNLVPVWQDLRGDMVPLYQWDGVDYIEWN